MENGYVSLALMIVSRLYYYIINVIEQALETGENWQTMLQHS